MQKKNESGKSSILEALEDFNINRNISDSAIPTKDKNLKPEITIDFDLTTEEVNDYFKKSGVDKIVNKGLNIQVTKKFPNSYTVNEENYDFLGINKESDEPEQAELKKNRIKTTYQQPPLHKQFLAQRNVKKFPFRNVKIFPLKIL